MADNYVANPKLRKRIHAVSLGAAAVLAALDMITTVTRSAENRRHIQAIRNEMKALGDGSCCRAMTRPAVAEDDSE